MTHPFQDKPRKKWSVNDWADFWRYDIGANIIPAVTQKKVTWIQWKEEGFQDNPIPEKQHNEWKAANAFKDGMAVMTGKIWHNKDRINYFLYCIDCDNKKAVELMGGSRLEESKSKTLIEWHDDNPDKIHIYGYTTYPIPKKSSDANSLLLSSKIDSNDIPSLEVKGKGKDGLMFCTPSIHEKGLPYVIGECLEPALTDGIEKEIDRICHMYGIPYLTDSLNDDKYKIPIMDLTNSDKIKVLAGHNRHECVLRVAEHYAATIPDITIDHLVEITNKRNKIICEPPLNLDQVKKLVEQGFKYVAKTIGLPKNKPRDEGKKKTREQIHVLIGTRIMDEYNFLTLSKTHEILYYYNGVHLYGGDEIISQEARSIYPSLKRHEIEEIKSYIRDKTGYHKIDEFDCDVYKNNVKNGIVDIRTGKLEAHHHGFYSRTQLPILYDESCIPFRFLKFIKSCHVDSQSIVRIFESMALCLIKESSFEKAYINTGRGSNGKSVFLSFLEAVLGKLNVSNHSIHDIEYDRFAIVDLDGKLANICADIKSDEIKSTGNLKKVVSGDAIQGQKKFLASYSFNPYAVLLFSANQIPEVNDESDGFTRRFEIIEWTKSFYGKDRDPTLSTMRYDQNEISGVFNIMMRCAAYLLRTRKLRYESTVSDMKTIWKEKADSVELFFKYQVSTGPEYSISKTEIFSAYVKWCGINKKIPVSTQKFSKKLEMKGLESIQTRVNRESTKVWKGCDLSSNLHGEGQSSLMS